MPKFFSIMIDELNDKTDKSCILVRVFYSCVGDICTRFLDMPIVNVGTACNLFDALKLSLSNHISVSVWPLCLTRLM